MKLYLSLLVVVSCVPAKPKVEVGETSKSSFDIMPTGEYFNQCLSFKQKDFPELKATHKKIVFSDQEPRFSLITNYYHTSCQEQSPKVAVSEHLEGSIAYGDYLDVGDPKVWTRRVEVTVSKMFYVAKHQSGLKLVRNLDDGARNVAVDQEYLITSGGLSKLYGVLSAMRGQRNRMHVYLHSEKVASQDIKKNLTDSNVYVQTVRK